MNKREGKPCRQGSKCPFGHDGFTGNICTDADYLSTGICSKFNDGCPDKHPWNEAKLGPKADLMQKLGHKQSSAAKRAFLHSVNMVTEVSPVTVVSLEEAGDLDMALRLQAMDATLGAAEVAVNSTMAAEDACAECNDVSMALCPDNLCSACCEMGGYECTDDEPVGLLVNGEQHNSY